VVAADYNPNLSRCRKGEGVSAKTARTRQITSSLDAHGGIDAGMEFGTYEGTTCAFQVRNQTCFSDLG